MNVIISESQSDKFIETLEKFINSQSFEGVCNIMIDYDEQFDRFVINVFFDKQNLLILGHKQTRFVNKTLVEISRIFGDFTGIKHSMYWHYKNCE